MTPWGVAAAGISFLDSVIYTPAQRAADETARAAAAASSEYARAQVALAEQQTTQAMYAASAQAEGQKTVLTLGLVGAGVAVAGLALFALR